MSTDFSTNFSLCSVWFYWYWHYIHQLEYKSGVYIILAQIMFTQIVIFHQRIVWFAMKWQFICWRVRSESIWQCFSHICYWFADHFTRISLLMNMKCLGLFCHLSMPKRILDSKSIWQIKWSPFFWVYQLFRVLKSLHVYWRIMWLQRRLSSKIRLLNFKL